MQVKNEHDQYIKDIEELAEVAKKLKAKEYESTFTISVNGFPTMNLVLSEFGGVDSVEMLKKIADMIDPHVEKHERAVKQAMVERRSELTKRIAKWGRK